jgi:hypothetical protein
MMIIETCQPLETETWSYEPPRLPMQVVQGAGEDVAFKCIEGAQKLAAAASAMLAMYMLA